MGFKMKLLLLASGRSYHATRWANALADKEIEVGFASVHKIERPISDKVKIFQLSTSGKIGYVFDVLKLRSVIKMWKPDILHAHYATGYGFMSKLSHFKPRIISIYGSDIYEFPKKSIIHKLILLFNVKGADKILSTSENMAIEFIKVYSSEMKIAVTPFGVDVDKFINNNLNIKRENTFNIGIVKKLEHNYGIDILMKAFNELKELMPETSIFLHIVGTGSKFNELQQLSDSLNLKKEVKFYGAIDNSEVPTLLNKLDLFVVPSRSESFGVAAVEAQACALPVIVSDVGGLPEVVLNEKTGIVVPKEDVSALVIAMKKLCENESLRRKLGSAGRRRVLKFYNWDKNVETMIDVYNRVIQGSN